MTGCWAQTSPGDVAAMEEVDLVVGNGDKHRLPELLDRIGAERVHVSDIGEVRAVEVTPAARLSGRSRAFLKVQDGCQHRCAFCVVPLARGSSIGRYGAEGSASGSGIDPGPEGPGELSAVHRGPSSRIDRVGRQLGNPGAN